MRKKARRSVATIFARTNEWQSGHGLSVVPGNVSSRNVVIGDSRLRSACITACGTAGRHCDCPFLDGSAEIAATQRTSVRILVATVRQLRDGISAAILLRARKSAGSTHAPLASCVCTIFYALSAKSRESAGGCGF